MKHMIKEEFTAVLSISEVVITSRYYHLLEVKSFVRSFGALAFVPLASFDEPCRWRTSEHLEILV